MYKLLVEFGFILLLTTLNIRGVRESVMALLPVFLLFLVTHAVLIGGGILGHLPEVSSTARAVAEWLCRGRRDAGCRWSAASLLPRLFAGRRHLHGDRGGLERSADHARAEGGDRKADDGLHGHLARLHRLRPSALLSPVADSAGAGENHECGVDRTLGELGCHSGETFIVLTLFSEAMLLVVAAQAGFLDGPRVLANMAVDSWVPHRFAALSERLTTQDGILLMGGAALAALLYTGGNVGHLVVMYSINVFLTFSLSMLAMLRFWCRHRRTRAEWVSPDRPLRRGPRAVRHDPCHHGV